MTPPEIQSIVPKETAMAATARLYQQPNSAKHFYEIRRLTQHDCHGVSDLSKEDRPHRWSPGRLESIRTVHLDPLLDIRLSQTLVGVDIERLKDFGRGGSVGSKGERAVDSGAVGVGSLDPSLFIAGIAIAVGSLFLVTGHFDRTMGKRTRLR